MDLKEMLEKAKSLLSEADALQPSYLAAIEAGEKEKATKLDAKAQGFLGQYDELMVVIETTKRIQGEKDRLNESQGLTAAPIGWRNASQEEGDVEVDEKSYREFEMKTFTYHPQLGIVPATKKYKFHIPLAVQKKGYDSVFEGYIRKGKDFLSRKDMKTLTEGLDNAGGFLSPADYQESIIKKIATMATMRMNARVIQTSRDRVQWPKITYTTDDNFTSGMRVTWVGESPASSTVHRVTDPVFGLHTIPIQTAMASIPLSNNLLEDSVFDVEQITTDLFAEAFALGENDAFWNGNGVDRPMGLLTQVDGAGPASVNSGTAATLLGDGLISLWGALPSQYEPNAKWYMEKATEVIIRKLKDDNGDYLWPVWQQVGGFGAAPRELLGFPTVRDEFLPTVAAGTYPIVYGDLLGYLIADRVGLSIQRLDELYAETNITVLLARKRVGGKTVEPYRIKVQKVSA